MLTALSEAFIDNSDFYSFNWLIQENMKKYRDPDSYRVLKPNGKAFSRYFFKNKSFSIEHYYFSLIFKILPTILLSVSYSLYRTQVFTKAIFLWLVDKTSNGKYWFS